MVERSVRSKSFRMFVDSILLGSCIVGFIGAIWLMGKQRTDTSHRPITIFEMLGIKKTTL